MYVAVAAFSSMLAIVCETLFCSVARSVSPFVPFAALRSVSRRLVSMLTVLPAAPAAVFSMAFAFCVFAFACSVAPMFEYVRWSVA